MLDFSQIILNRVALHRAGSIAREETDFESGSLLRPTPEQEVALLTYFLGPFGKQREVMRFNSEQGPEQNTIFKISSSIFANPADLLAGSVDILKQLHQHSEHPHIKSGELFVAHLSDVVYEDEITDAIGIFKAETKHDFLKFQEEGFENLLLEVDNGVHVGKLDKGCLIINTDKEEGYAVVSVDANNYDAHYWKDHFLGLGVANTESFQTRSYLELCQEFTEEAFPQKTESGGRPEQMAFMEEAVSYMEENEVVSANDFAQTVIKEPAMQASFMEFKDQFDAANPFPIQDEFEVSKPALKSQSKKIKNQISLDNNIQIKLPFGLDAHEQFIERGFDEGKGMYFYKVFFNSERD